MIQSINVWHTGDARTWLVRVEDIPGRPGLARLTVHPLDTDGAADAVFVADATALHGTHSAVDGAGDLWVTWSEPEPEERGTVFLARVHGGAPGPRIQVSARGGGTRPHLLPDEYGNMWVVWLQSEGEGAGWWTCRFGPRSGQPLWIGGDTAATVLSAFTREGTIALVLSRDLSPPLLIIGDERRGFTEPKPLW